MKYRGNVYKSENNFLEVKETDVIAGKYRGCEWNHKLPRHIPQLRPKLGLQYRGISYCHNPLIASPTKVPLSLGADYSITTTPKHHNLHDIHLQNMRRNLDRRIKVAQQENNENLLLMLKKESLELELV